LFLDFGSAIPTWIRSGTDVISQFWRDICERASSCAIGFCGQNLIVAPTNSVQMEPLQRFVGDYELFELIGTGSFATVWLGRHRLTGCPVAIKEYVFTTTDSLTIEVLATMRREISIMRLLDHPFICDLFDVIESDLAGYLVMEYAEEGTLLDYANRRDSLLDEDDLRYFFVEIVCVLSYLHKEKRILH
jgi:serine/threonine protein kinase